MGLGRAGVATGGNSGYQAVNLAYLLGAKRIGLIGFDMRGGEFQHFHGDHGGGLNNPTPSLFAEWIPRFNDLHRLLAAEGVELINYSRESALTVPRGEL